MNNTNASFDDDSALFTKDGEKVLTIRGSKRNFKIFYRLNQNFTKKGIRNKKRRVKRKHIIFNS